jgi:nucleoside-diphosphate-sugar epimerase
MLIVGCGRLGGIFARIWREREPGDAPVCTVRRPESVARLAGFEARVLDLLDASAVREVVAGHPRILISASSGTDGPDVWRRGIANLAAAADPGTHVVHVSSTGVYAGAGGAEVREGDARDSGGNAGALLEAERALAPLDPTILRCSGLMGPQLGPHRVLDRLAGTERAEGWINLVWMDDVVEVIVEAFVRDVRGTFDVSGSTLERSGFYAPLLEAKGLAPIRWTDGGDRGYRVAGDRLAGSFRHRPRPVTVDEVLGLLASDRAGD